MPVNGDFNGLLNRVTQGDAIEVLRQLPSESVDLIRFACGRIEAIWKDLEPDKREHIHRVGWIAEFDGAASEAQA